jgi:cytochrome c oxidase subunit 2
VTRKAGLLGAALAGLTLTGCHVPGFAVQQAADKQGQQAANLWHRTEFIALAVGVIVWGLILYTVVRYRGRHKEGIPSQRAYHVPLEVIYTVIPVIIVACLFVFTTTAQRKMDAVSTHPDTKIGATAFQWGWRFAYPGGAVTVSDNGIPPDLYLPFGQTTEIDLTATDVVHAFYVPAFLFQRAAVPGSPTRFDLTPTKLGVYPGKCATFCGVKHDQMLFTVHVVTPTAYQQFLTTQ